MTTNNNEVLRFDTEQSSLLQPAVSRFDIYALVNENDPILSTPAQVYDFDNPPMDTLRLANSLFATMFEKRGLGLAAPQCGIPYQVFVVGADRDNKQIFFNPTLVDCAIEEDMGPEGCLSFPNLILKVKRPKWILMKFQMPHTKQWEEHRYEGLTARIIMHEYDHLQGTCFTKRVGKTSLLLAMDKRRKFNKKLERLSHGKN